MTNDDIDRVSRSWAGHLATNPELRNAVNAAGDDAALAGLINRTLAHKIDVTAADVPAIKTRIATFFAQDAGDLQSEITALVKTGPGGGP